MLRIKLVKSLIGNNKRNRSIVAALGLRKMHHTVDHKDTPQIRGMIHRVKHMLEVTEIADGDARPRTTGTPRRARTTSVVLEAPVMEKPTTKPKSPKAEPAVAKPKAAKAPKAAKPLEDATSEEKPKRTRKPATANEQKRED